MRIKSKLEETGLHIRDYYETVTELKKLQAVEKASSAFSAAAAIIAAVVILFMALIFVSIVVGLYTDFIYVAGFYLLLGLLLLVFRKQLISKPLQNVIIKNFFDNEEKD